MKSYILSILLLTILCRDYHHSTLKVGADDNIEALYINENPINLYGEHLYTKSEISTFDLVLFPGDEIKIVASNGEPTKRRKEKEVNDKHLINFNLFGHEGGFFVEKKNKKFLNWLWNSPASNGPVLRAPDPEIGVPKIKIKEEEKKETKDVAGLAVTLEYSDQKGDKKVFVSGEDWECNGKKPDLIEKVKGSENWKEWEGQLNDDSYVMWSEGDPKSVTCSFVIPKL